jgi:hypothetical protein
VAAWTQERAPPCDARSPALRDLNVFFISDGILKPSHIVNRRIIRRILIGLRPSFGVSGHRRVLKSNQASGPAYAYKAGEFRMRTSDACNVRVRLCEETSDNAQLPMHQPRHLIDFASKRVGLLIRQSYLY